MIDLSIFGNDGIIDLIENKSIQFIQGDVCDANFGIYVERDLRIAKKLMFTTKETVQEGIDKKFKRNYFRKNKPKRY